MIRAAGPLGEFVSYEPGADRDDPGTVLLAVRPDRPVDAAKASGTNGTLLLRRIAWVDERGHILKPAEATAPTVALLTATAHAMDPSHSRQLLAAARARRAAAVARLEAQGRLVRKLTVRPEWRLVVGLGEQTPAEVGLAVHGTYGVPVLPGSALKGLARAWTRTLAADGQPVGQEFVRAAFGAEPGETGQSGRGGETEPAGVADGRVVFLDALPEPLGRAVEGVTVDVMTPHVGGYYGDGGQTPPAEYHQPVPVSFFAVTSAVAFTVYLVGRGADQDTSELVLDDDALAGWLAEALEQAGLGAKTNAGYGYLVVQHEEAGG